MVNKIDICYENPIDIIICKFIDTHLDFYKKIGFTPNMITTLSLISGIGSAYYIMKSKFISASLLFLLAYYFDCVDGKLARKYDMITEFGDYYDHYSDIFKFVIIIYALYKTNKKEFGKIKYILIILTILMLIHFGYQETIYDSDESPSLKSLKNIIKNDKNLHKTIKYTRFFGCGTLQIMIAFIIFIWYKE